MNALKWTTLLGCLAVMGCADAALDPVLDEDTTPAYSDGKADNLATGATVPTVHGWAEGSAEAERVLDVANGLGMGALYGTTGLDYATAHRIDEYRRRFGSYETLGDLDRILGVGAREFQLLWAWGERHNWTVDAPPRPALDPDSPEAPFDPNGCVGTPMSVEDALALLGEDEQIELGTSLWSTEYQACYYRGYCEFSHIRDDGERYEGQLSLRRFRDNVFAEINYLRDGQRTDVQESCRVGADCPNWTLNNECVVYAKRGTLTALTSGDWTRVTQGFFFGLDEQLRPPPFSQTGGESATTEADLVLESANTLSYRTLDLQVGLTTTAARNIVEHRAGSDGTEGTDDDNTFDSIDELLDVYGVGPRSLEKLLVYGRTHNLTARRHTSNPEMPLTGGMDPMTCTGPKMTPEDADRALGSRDSMILAHGEVFYQRSECDGEGDCLDSAPELRGAATLELWRNPNADNQFGITMRAHDANVPVKQRIAACGLTDEHCSGYDWHFEIRQECARFNWNIASRGLRDDYAANFEF